MKHYYKTAKYFLLFSLMLLFSVCSTARDRTKKAKGYLIYFEWRWIFQPCSLSNTGLLESLNGKSFEITTGTDGYNNAISVLKDSLNIFSTIYPVFYQRRSDTTHFVGPLKYVYCEMKYKNEYSEFDKEEHFIPAIFQISANNRIYSLSCYWRHPRVDVVNIIRR